jgi:hypothetical protein
LAWLFHFSIENIAFVTYAGTTELASVDASRAQREVLYVHMDVLQDLRVLLWGETR